jgi:AcrR family transcriptional regulator
MQDKKSSQSYDIKSEQIIEAAEDTFAYYGYHKTTLEDIAKKVGIKKNSIYYYFKSKEDLLNEIITRIYKWKIDQFEKETVSVKSTKDKLKIFFLMLISPIVTDKKTYNVTPNAFIEIGRVIYESFREFYQNTEFYLTTILKEGIKKGELKKIDTEKTAQTILLFVQAVEMFEYSQITSKYIDKPTFDKLEIEISNFIDLIYNGIKK